MTLAGNKLPVKGLVLAGGRSTRMGQDKGMMVWYNKPQRYYLADLLREVCDEVFISCREEQIAEMPAGYPTLTDTVSGMGPMGGILSAFHKYPAATWLVAACDLPLLDRATLNFLIHHRNPQAIATTFKSPYDGLPEPLITLWEPGSMPILQQKMNDGFKCPRKVLINSNATILTAPDERALMNTNTPDDAAVVLQLLRSNSVPL